MWSVTKTESDMCLYVREGCKPETADKPIRVWKWVAKDGDGWRPVHAGSRGRHQFGVVLKAKRRQFDFWVWLERYVPIDRLWVVRDDGKDAINEGFHAATSLAGVIKARLLICGTPRLRLVPAVIPVGAEYCYGTDYDVVATRMVVFKSLRSRRKWMKNEINNPND